MTESALRTEATSAERASRLASLICCSALLLLGLGWGLSLGHPVWAFIKSLPLLPALLGLWRYRLYTYRWVSLLVWLYATEGLVHLGSSTGLSRWLGSLETLLAVALFSAVTVHIRQRLAAAKSAAASA